MKKFVVLDTDDNTVFEGTRRQCRKFTRTTRAKLKVKAVTVEEMEQPIETEIKAPSEDDYGGLNDDFAEFEDFDEED